MTIRVLQYWWCSLCGHNKHLPEGEKPPKKCPACNDGENIAYKYEKPLEVEGFKIPEGK